MKGLEKERKKKWKYIEQDKELGDRKHERNLY